MRWTVLFVALLGLLISADVFAQTCAGQPATIIGTEDDDDIQGTGGDDVIVGLGGNDRIDGGAGSDLICGGGGDDDLIGGDGDDQLFGDADNDVMAGDAGIDSCDGGTGVDSADEPCETVTNTDTVVFPVSVPADDGTPLAGALYMPTGEALINGEYRRVAIIVTHGAMGSFSSSVPKIIGLQGSPLGFSVLALDRRDAGMDGGGGTVLFEETTADVGAGINLLAALGYELIYIAGHSQGTQNVCIYPSFFPDPRVAAVGQYGTVDDGRAVARDLLFNEFIAPIGYSELEEIAKDFVEQGEGDVVQAWDTIFGVPVFRSSNNWLSFWGSESLSVCQREVEKMPVPLLMLRADGDEFTPDEMSQNVLAAALDAGVDAEYTVLPYPFPLTDNGGNAHGFVGVERETIATTVAWLEDRVPESAETTPDVRMPTEDGTGNFRPLAYAGERTTFSSNEANPMLDGRGSQDIDGDIVGYLWVQTEGPPVTLDDPTSPTPSFPNPGPTDELAFELTVTDNDGASDTVPFTAEIKAGGEFVAKIPGGSTTGPFTLGALGLLLWLRRRRL
jgi:pimeloyl-ACP methyl ester carboxylesterase